MLTIQLNPHEIAILDQQDPSTKNDGGYQRLMVDLQERVNRTTGAVTLTLDDIRRIHSYAFKYGNGGWETRLKAIFSRTLGPDLGSHYLPQAA